MTAKTYQGKPCKKYGHTERYASNRNCVACAEKSEAARREKRAKYYAEYRAEHREERAKYNVMCREERAKYNAKYNAEHREERAAKAAKYYAEHREERIKHDAEYRTKHREERAKYNAKYNAEHRKEKREWQYNRKKINPGFYWSRKTREQIRRLFIDGKSDKHFVELLGCTIPEFQKYLQGLWEANGHIGEIPRTDEIQLHHIVPVSYGMGKSDTVKAAICHYTNLIPLTVAEHKSQHDWNWFSTDDRQLPYGFDGFSFENDNSADTVSATALDQLPFERAR